MVLTISRTSRITISTEPVRNSGEAVGVNGTGSGSLDYVLDVSSGEVVSAKGSATLDLTLRSRLRSQVVRQTVEIRIGRT